MPRQLINVSGSWTYQDVSISPAGSNTQVQFNDSGVFGGSSGLTFNKITNTLTSTTVNATALSGSLTKLTNGSNYLLAGTDITLATGSNGAVTITSTAPAVVSSVISASYIVTSQATTSTSFTDLATVGPTVTLTTGTSVVCHAYARVVPSSAAGSPVISVAVSGATTIAASDSIGANGGGAASVSTPSAGYSYNMGASFIFTGLTPGSNTFTLKYRTDNASWAQTFADRALVVQRLN
jgi:hypothetical protein